MFKLDISSLSTFEESLTSELEKVLSERDACDTAMITLAEVGYQGDSQVASAERFNDWINNLDGLTVLLDGYWITCDVARAKANSIMKLCDNLPASLGAGTSSTSENTGTLMLNDTYYMVISSTQSIVDVDLEALRKDITRCALDLTTVTGATSIFSALSNLSSSIDEVEIKLREFNSAYTKIVNEIYNFESEISQSLSELCDGDIEAQRNTLNELAFSESLGFALAANEAAALVGSGTWTQPANMHFEDIKVSRSDAFYNIKRAVSGRYVAKHTSIGVLAQNKQLMGYTVFKTAKIAGRGLAAITVVVGIAEGITRTTEEYDRNPYLPEVVRQARTDATAQDAAYDVGFSVATMAICASIGSAAGPVGTVVGAAIGLVVGIGYEVIMSSDIDSDGRSFREEHIDTRSKQLISCHE